MWKASLAVVLFGCAHPRPQTQTLTCPVDDAHVVGVGPAPAAPGTPRYGYRATSSLEGCFRGMAPDGPRPKYPFATRYQFDPAAKVIHFVDALPQHLGTIDWPVATDNTAETASGKLTLVGGPWAWDTLLFESYADGGRGIIMTFAWADTLTQTAIYVDHPATTWQGTRFDCADWDDVSARVQAVKPST